jgi:protein TonB
MSRQAPSRDIESARFQFGLVIAAAIHALLILGLGFGIKPPEVPLKSIEVTLTPFRSATETETHDFVAQASQQGSGTLKDKQRQTRANPPPAPDNAPRPVSEALSAPPATAQRATPPTLTARTSETTRQQAEPIRPTESAPLPPSLERRLDRLDQQIASLSMDFDLTDQFNSRKTRYRLSGNLTRQEKGAAYLEAWRRKVMRIGELNYPREATRRGLYGKVKVLVAINKDGSLNQVRILKSSGEPILDQAALRIINLSAPFAPLTSDLADIEVLEIVRYWTFEQGFSSRG